MKKLFVMLLMMLLATALIIGCGQKAEESDKTPPDVKEAESMDQTAMDEAVSDSGVVDSLAGEVKDAVDEGAEAAKDAAEKVKEEAGH